MRICPDCGSEKLKPDLSARTSFLHGDVNSYICESCGYTGLTPEKVSENTDEDKNENEEPYVLRLVLAFVTLIILISIWSRVF